MAGLFYFLKCLLFNISGITFKIMKKIKVYVWEAGDDYPDSLTGIEVIELCKTIGNVYSLAEFENQINGNALDLTEKFIRFIED